MTFEREPHLRMAITPHCNLSCCYCKPGGESTAPNGCLLPQSEIVQIAVLANRAGFKHIKFTGGEPLLRADIVGLVRAVCEKTRFISRYVVTNGLLLAEKAASLKDAGITHVVVSLDVANAKKFKEINGGNVMQFKRILKGLEQCNACRLPVTLNMVVMKKNLSQLNGIIKIAKKYHAKLKLIDLMNMNNNAFWKEQFVPFSEIDNRLLQHTDFKDTEKPIGNLGTTMNSYLLNNGVKVITRDASAGAFYSKKCKQCTLFPCQDAIYGARVTHDGKLKQCLFRNDNLVDIVSDLRSKKKARAFAKMRAFYNVFAKAKYFEKNRLTKEDIEKICDLAEHEASVSSVFAKVHSAEKARATEAAVLVRKLKKWRLNYGRDNGFFS